MGHGPQAAKSCGRERSLCGDGETTLSSSVRPGRAGGCEWVVVVVVLWLVGGWQADKAQASQPGRGGNLCFSLGQRTASGLGMA